MLGLHRPQKYSILDLQEAFEMITSKKQKIDVVEVEQLLKLLQQKLPVNKVYELSEMMVAIDGSGLLAEETAKPN